MFKDHWEIIIVSLDTEKDYDFLTIAEDMESIKLRKGKTLSGNDIPDHIHIFNNYFVLQFTSDSRLSLKGFVLHFVAIFCKYNAWLTGFAYSERFQNERFQ